MTTVRSAVRDLDEAEREAAEEALSLAGDGQTVDDGPSAALGPIVPETLGAALPPTATDAEVADATRLAIEHLPGRSTRLETCPFLRAIAAGELQRPRDAVDGRNRCGALPEPQPLSRVQQAFVCLQASHVNCPRYVRGAMLVQERIAPERPRPAARQLPVVAAAAAFVVIAVLVGAYTLLRGGFGPAAPPSPTAAPTAAALATATPATTTAPPAPTAVPSPTPVRRPTPAPTILPARYRGLERCPAPQRCFVYRVRRGDTMFSIAEFYRTNTDTLRTLNPRINATRIEIGDPIRIPPP